MAAAFSCNSANSWITIFVRCYLDVLTVFATLTYELSAVRNMNHSFHGADVKPAFLRAKAMGEFSGRIEMLWKLSKGELLIKYFRSNKCSNFADRYYLFICSWHLLAFAMLTCDVKMLHAPYQHKGDLLVTKDVPLSSISILFNHVLRSWIIRYRNTAGMHGSVTKSWYRYLSLSRKSKLYWS